ncbi:MAG TPA: hypothetical protein VF116_05460 [Ktedonobacterales bacterium]
MRGWKALFGETPAALTRRYRVLLATILGLLGLQFLLGMLANLFVTVPTAHPGAHASEYFSGVAQDVVWALGNAVAALRLHVIVGLLLFLAALWLLVLAIVARRRGRIVVAAVGLFGIWAAGMNGASFMNYFEDFSSLLMALGFMVAAIAYVIGYGMRAESSTTR